MLTKLTLALAVAFGAALAHVDACHRGGHHRHGGGSCEGGGCSAGGCSQGGCSSGQCGAGGCSSMIEQSDGTCLAVAGWNWNDRTKAYYYVSPETGTITHGSQPGGEVVALVNGQWPAAKPKADASAFAGVR